MVIWAAVSVIINRLFRAPATFAGDNLCRLLPTMTPLGFGPAGSFCTFETHSVCYFQRRTSVSPSGKPAFVKKRGVPFSEARSCPANQGRGPADDSGSPPPSAGLVGYCNEPRHIVGQVARVEDDIEDCVFETPRSESVGLESQPNVSPAPSRDGCGPKKPRVS